MFFQEELNLYSQQEKGEEYVKVLIQKIIPIFTYTTHHHNSSISSHETNARGRIFSWKL